MVAVTLSAFCWKPVSLQPNSGSVTELGQPLSQRSLRQELRNEERRPVRLRGSWTGHLEILGVRKTAVRVVFTLRRIRRAAGQQPIDHTEILKYLESAGLNALAARASERFRQLVDQAKTHSAARQLHRQGETGRPRATNQHIRRIHGSPQICVFCTYLSSPGCTSSRKCA